MIIFCDKITELPRLEKNHTPVSASAVRKAYEAGDLEAVRALVPQTTFDYLTKEVSL